MIEGGYPLRALFTLWTYQADLDRWLVWCSTTAMVPGLIPANAVKFDFFCQHLMGTCWQKRVPIFKSGRNVEM